MIDDDAGGEALEVGFVINTEGAFAEMLRFAQMFDDKTAQFVRKAAEIEAAAGGIKLGSATSSVEAFADAATRDLATAGAAFAGVGEAKASLDATLARPSMISAFAPAATRGAAAARAEINKTERAIELMIGRLDGEAAAVGKTRDELRDMRIETLALTAAQHGNTDAADRLLASTRALSAARQADTEDRHAAQMAAEAAAARDLARSIADANGQLRERALLQGALDRTNGADRPRAVDAGAGFSALSAKAAEDEARATALVASAARQAADEHSRLASMVRGSQSAMEADAAAAERLRASTDPLYAATRRLNDEIAESTRLYHAGATAPAEYARQQQVLAERLTATARQHEAMAASATKSGFAVKQFAIQMPDIVQGLLTGQKPMTVFIQQGGQIAQIAMMAEGGVKGFAKEIGGLALSFLPLAAAAAVAGVAVYRWQNQLNDDTDMKKYAAGLGLTQKEMKKLGDQSITTGDLLAGLWQTVSEGADLGGSGKSIMDHLFAHDDMKQVQGFVASIYGTFAGGYDAIVALWGSMSSTVSGYISAIASAASQFFAPVVAAAQWAGKTVGSVFNTVYQWVAGWVKSIAGWISPILGAIGKSEAATAISNAGSGIGETFGKAYAARVAGFVNGSNAFVDKVGANATTKAQQRLKKQADAMIADRTPKKPATDKHAEALVRDAEAVEAQIRNLYKLADAYGVSGAEALIAEARVKAESKAIKQQADITAAVSRQVQLAIAQRVSDAAKSTAGMRDQVAAQQQVNAAVAAGLVPAERANDLIAAQIADLPLLAAVQAAEKLGLADAAARATRELQDQRKARADLTAAEEAGRFNSDMAGGRNEIATLAEELRLVGATNDAREIGLATLKATQEAEAKFTDPARRAAYVAQQVDIVKGHQAVTNANDALNASLSATTDLFDTVDQTAQRAAQGMADAFGQVGTAIGNAATVMTSYYAEQASLQQTHDAAIKAAGTDQTRIARENQLFALRTASAQAAVYGDMASAAKGFFKEGTAGYKAMATAEKVFRAIEFAMAVKNAAVQLGLIGGITTARTVAAATGAATDTAFTASSVVNAGARAAADGTAAMAKTAASSPFPFNLAGMAVMAAALASLGIVTGFFGGGGKNTLPKANEGTGTVLGDTAAQSESLKRSMDALKEVDTLTNTYARQMAASLKSIDSQIGNVAALVVRAGDVNASAGVKEGFASDTTGKLLSGIVTGGGLFSKIPVVGSIIGAVGGLIGSLFGSKTTVVGSGLYGKDQQLGSILGGGFDASYYSDVEKKKKFLGISTGTSYSTKYTGADAGLENQFTLILRQFNDAITAAAGPLGVATGEVQARLNSFVVSIGKIDLKGLTGEQIQEKLTAVFGAAADKMATTAFPGFERFQKVGEGAFETLVRVASTIEAVGNSLDLLGTSATGFSIDAKLALADQFDSVSDLTSAAGAYFEAFYTKEEQAAAKTAQFARVFDSLGLAMPASLSGFRALVEAQDLTTAAGQSTYATLLKLAPAFADLQSAMEGARSAADIAAERQDLERKLLELKGDTATLRALDLAKLDVSNRALQQQIWAIQDAQEAAKAAEALRDAWTSVGDGLMDEVKRIRGLTDAGNGNGFAALQGQFNAATSAARGGDQDAAKSLPALSQALLAAAAEQATSRQELERVRAMTAASLEATYGVISALGNGTAAPTTEQATSRQELDRVQAMTDASRQAAYGVVSALAGGTAASGKAVMPIDTMIAAADVATGKTPTPANDDLAADNAALREELEGLRRDINSGLAAIAGNTKGIDRKLDDITADHGGMAISVGNASAAR